MKSVQPEYSTPSDDTQGANDNKTQDGKTYRLDVKTSCKFKLLSFTDLEALPDPEWLIDGIMPVDGLAVLYGKEKSKKTFVAVDWACSVATGTPWNGRTVKQGDVVYIAGEGLRGLPSRIRAWIAAHGGLVPDRLFIIGRRADIRNLDDVAKLIQAIEAAGAQPRLIVIDTLARNFGDGDENKAQDMNAFVQGCDALRFHFAGCTVMPVHHAGKDKTKGGRGSTALDGALDTRIFCDSKPGQPGGTIACTAQKDAAEFPTLTFKLVDAGQSMVLEWITEAKTWDDVPEAPERLAPNQAKVMQALAGYPDGLPFGELRKLSGVKANTFPGVLKMLQKRQLVEKDEENGNYHTVITP